MMTFVRTSMKIALVLSAGLGSAIALAQPRDEGAIVISVPQQAKPGDNQRSVNFRDLAINRPAGQTALLHRVGYAIDSLCENSVASSDPVGALKCTNMAWDGVKPQLDRLLKR